MNVRRERRRIAVAAAEKVVATAVLFIMASCGTSSSVDARRNHYNMTEIGSNGPAVQAPKEAAWEITEFSYNPCQSSPEPNSPSRTIAATTIALRECGWTMDEMQFNSSWISAHACLRNSPDNCAVLVFQALPDARLYVRNPTKRFVRFDLRDDVQRWMVVFEQSFSVTRCYTVATLQEEMAKFGYTPPPPP